MHTSQNPRPYKVTEAGRTLASTATLRQAQVAVARRIASDAEGRVLVITGPDGYRCHAQNAGLAIRYEEVRPTTAGTSAAEVREGLARLAAQTETRIAS